ncbi:hypothetical protein TRIUR3_33505 [Triticum urartu]|uniref:Uncharacterized protein n=1 Tax=Triticum urartu TaxID=4572 RepID=M8ATP6_TRIUA|nr:hypothetical protein TRIUR3_33505 [Triticum urartu]
MSTDADHAAVEKAEADKKAAEDAAAAKGRRGCRCPRGPPYRCRPSAPRAPSASATAGPPAAPAAPMPLAAVQEVPVAALQAVQAGRRICKNIMLCKNMAVQSPEVKKLRHLPTPPPPG